MLVFSGHLAAKFSESVDIGMYKNVLNATLTKVNIPQCLLGCSYMCNSIDHHLAIDKYYANIFDCIKQCTDECIPSKKMSCY